MGRTDVAYECSHEHGCGDRCLSLELNDSILEGAGVSGQTVPALPPLPGLAARLLLAAGERQVPGRTLRLEELAHEIAGAVAAEHERVAGKRRLPYRASTRADWNRIERAAHYLRVHAHETIRLEHLSREAGLSPFHFLRLFRSCLGITPHQLLVRHRLQHGVALLLATRRSVTDVAYEVGFGDVSNFVRTFRRETGFSPGALRSARESPSKILQARR